MSSLNSFTFKLHELVWQIDKTADVLLRKQFKITFKQFLILVKINSHDPPISQSELARALGVSRAATSKQIPILRKKGWVTVISNTRGKRSNVALSVKGEKELHQCLQFLEKTFMQIVDPAQYTLVNRAHKDLDTLLIIFLSKIKNYEQ